MSAPLCGTCHAHHQPHCVATTRRWPVADLVRAVGHATYAKVVPRSSHQFAVKVGGFSDQTADRWAVALGLHPAEVWGWDEWAEAALTPLDAVRLAGGWRPAWEYAESAPASGAPMTDGGTVAA